MAHGTYLVQAPAVCAFLSLQFYELTRQHYHTWPTQTTLESTLFEDGAQIPLVHMRAGAPSLPPFRPTSVDGLYDG